MCQLGCGERCRQGTREHTLRGLTLLLGAKSRRRLSQPAVAQVKHPGPYGRYSAVARTGALRPGVHVALVAASILVLAGALAQATDALTIRQYPLPEYPCNGRKCHPDQPSAIMAGTAGRVLAAGVEGGSKAGDIYSEVTLGGEVQMAPGPAGSPAQALIRGPDGNPWAINEAGPNWELVDAMPGGVSTLYRSPTDGPAPRSLTTGGGSVWITIAATLDRIADGRLTEYAPMPGRAQEARQVAFGPAESAWFTDGTGAIDQVTGAGEIIEHSSEPEALDPVRAIPEPEGIAAGLDGSIWWTDPNNGRIGRMTPGGAVQLFPVPSHELPPPRTGNRPWPTNIVAGPDGKMYFTDPGDFAIGIVTMSGEITEYRIPSAADVRPGHIITDGQEVVFDESGVGTIGVLDPAGVPSEAPLSTPPTIEALRSSIVGQLATAGHLAARSLAGRQPRRFSFVGTALEPGSLTFTWTAEITARTPRKKGRGSVTRKSTVTVASAGATFLLPGSLSIDVHPTSGGEQLIRRYRKLHKNLALTAHASFSGSWSGEIEASDRQLVRSG